MSDKELEKVLEGVQNARVERVERKIFDLEKSNQGAGKGSGTQPASVERGRIISVNIRTFTVDARTENTNKLFSDKPFMTPYCGQSQGEGMNFMPEVGTVCWICTPGGDHEAAFILGWSMASEDGSYRGGRVLLNPGDIHYSTQDGNFLILRRGGVVQIGSTPVCQTIYLPLLNSIRQYSENYEVHTPGGDLTWLVDRDDENGEGHKETTLILAAKEFADDPNDMPIAVLKMGSHKASGTTILSLETAQGKTSLKIEKSGNVSWEVQNLTLTAKGKADVTVTGPLRATAASIQLTTAGALTASATAGVALTSSGGSIGIVGGVPTIDGSQITLGAGTSEAVINSPDFATWVQTVTANLNTAIAALTTGAGAAPVPGLTPVTAPTEHVSKKVKAS